MTKQYIIHRMLMDEIMEFKRKNLVPNTITMSSDVLYHMLGWEDIMKYYYPAETTKEGKAKYYGLDFIEARCNNNQKGIVCVSIKAKSGKVGDIEL